MRKAHSSWLPPEAVGSLSHSSPSEIKASQACSSDIHAETKTLLTRHWYCNVTAVGTSARDAQCGSPRERKARVYQSAVRALPYDRRSSVLFAVFEPAKGRRRRVTPERRRGGAALTPCPRLSLVVALGRTPSGGLPSVARHVGRMSI